MTKSGERCRALLLGHGDDGVVGACEVLGDLQVLGVWPNQAVSLGELETGSFRRLYL